VAEYGYNPPNSEDDRRRSLLTGAATVGGLFALGKGLKPWADKTLAAEMQVAFQQGGLAFTPPGWMKQTTALRAMQRRTIETNLLYNHLQGKAPEANSIHALGMFISRSPLMTAWQKASQTFLPLQIADKLAFGPELREMYGTAGKSTSQFQALGRIGKLGLLTPEELQKRGISEHARAYFVGGKVHVVQALLDSPGEGAPPQLLWSKIHTIEGKYWLYGKAGIGEKKNAIERMRGDLLGESYDVGNIHARISRNQKLISRIRGDVIREERGISQEEGVRLFNLETLNEKLEKIAAIRDPGNTSLRARAQRFFDVGLNERGAAIWSKEGREKFWQSRFGNIAVEDLPEARRLADQLPFGVARAMEFTPTGLKNMFFGATRGTEINTGTFAAYHLLERINTGMAYNGLFPWLAMSGSSTEFKLGKLAFKGPTAYFANVMLKRALPIAAGIFYAGYLNDELGKLMGRRPTDQAQLAKDKGELWWAGLKDKLGISPWLKHVDELSGGVLSHIAHPFVDAKVGLSQEELKEQQDSGYVPVRKGRWWSFGSSTPFRGERIQYFAPNAHRQALAGDITKTDTLFGSVDEYYANAALPTPTHPFSWAQHFLFDRYHYEKKHYKDRPYPISAPLFEPTSPWGALLNPILGPILKPTKYMHAEDLPYLISGPHQGERNPKYRGDLRTLNEQIKEKAANQELTGFVTASGQILPMGAVGLPGSDRAIAAINDDTQDDADDSDAGYDEGVQRGSYGKGARAIAPYGSAKAKTRQKIRESNEKLKAAQRFTPGRMLEGTQAPGLFKSQDPNDPRSLKRLINPNDPRYQAGLGYYSLTEIGGIYGFAAASTVDYPYSNLPTLQSAGRMTSFERQYWDNWNTGGMLPTPGLSEAFRRFLPHRYHSNTEYNPIRNTMPTWLPGQGGEDPAYFLDFLHGDPYVTIPNGEARLPGAAYEKLHGIPAMDLKLRSTQIGYSRDGLYGLLTGDHEPFYAYSQEIAERGGELHEKIKHELLGESPGGKRDVSYDDKKLGISGTVDFVTKDGNPIEIHTLSQKRYRELHDTIDARHREQLNLDMAELGAKQGGIVYVNRDNPNEQRSAQLTFDQDLYDKTIAKVDDVRKQIAKETKEGLWSQGQFYDDVTKLEILGDVAPWSSQYRRYRDYLVHLPEGVLSDEDRARIKTVKEQVTQRKHRVTMAPYHLRYAQLDYETVHIDKMIDNNTFTTLEHPDNPIRLAGVHVRSDADATTWLSQNLGPGRTVKIGYAHDQAQRVSKDTLNTIHAVVFSHGRMLNREAIDQDYGSETQDSSPAGMHAQYTSNEIAWAGALERIGHLPITLLHNKYMALDSPIELYKRTQVYGKDWQDWKHPFRDYIFPSFESAAAQGIAGMAVAGAIGYFLGVGPLYGGKLIERLPNTKFGFKLGKIQLKSRAILMGASMAIAGALAFSHKVSQDPIPEYRKKERETKEYFDILKYMKYEGLYEKTRAYVLKHEHKDIGAIIDRYEREGDDRKHRISQLRQEKRRIIIKGDKKKQAKRLHEINQEISELQSYRKELKLTRDDILAIQYRQVAQTTLYGAKPGSDLQKVLLSLDPKEREFFQAFLKAPGPERKEILKMVPKNERRFLQAAYGLKVDEKPELIEYFKHHYLPPADWNGWQAENSLDDYRLVVTKQEGLDMTSQGFWPQDEERVSELGIKDIRPFRETPGNIKANLHRVLDGMGLRDIDIQLYPNNAQQHQVNMQIQQAA
jgi:hypothetical protein